MNPTQKNSMNDSENPQSNAGDRRTDQGGNAGKTVARGAEDLTASLRQGAKDASTTVKDGARDLASGMQDAADNGSSRVGDVLRKAQDVAQDAKAAVLSSAESTLATVRDVAVEKADDARESLSDVGDRLAATLNRVSGDSADGALQSRLLSSVAQGLTRASSTLRERSVAELTDDVKGLARRHPGAFMAAAAVVGFAAARFVRSSARRRVTQAMIDEARGPRS